MAKALHPELEREVDYLRQAPNIKRDTAVRLLAVFGSVPKLKTLTWDQVLAGPGLEFFLTEQDAKRLVQFMARTPFKTQVFTAVK